MAAGAAGNSKAPARVPAKPKTDEELYVQGDIPDALLPGLTRKFTEEEELAVRHAVHISSADRDNEQPTTLWVCGPSAVGKSTITTTRSCDLFGSEENAVIIDGSILRDIHSGWQAVVADGFRRQPRPLIHKKAWDILKDSKVLDSKKKTILAEAISGRQHLVIPDTAAKLQKVKDMVDKLHTAGYKQHMVCLWAPREVTRARGEIRAIKEGKAFSMRGYQSAIENCCALAEMFTERFGVKSCEIMSTDRFPNMHLTIGELKQFAMQSKDMEEGDARITAAASRVRLLHAMKKTHTAVKMGMAAKELAFSKSQSMRRPSTADQPECGSDPGGSPATGSTTASMDIGRFVSGGTSEVTGSELQSAEHTSASLSLDSSLLDRTQPAPRMAANGGGAEADVDALRRRVSELETELRTLRAQVPEKRRDPTDPGSRRRYTRREFIDFYGKSRGQKLWRSAAADGAAGGRKRQTESVRD